MKPLDQKQRQRLAAIRFRSWDQHKCDPEGIERNLQRRVGLRVHDDSLFLIECLGDTELTKQQAERVKKISTTSKEVCRHDPEGVEKNTIAPVKLGVFGDHDFLLQLIDAASKDIYKLDRSEPDPDAAPPPLNAEPVEAPTQTVDEVGIPA